MLLKLLIPALLLAQGLTAAEQILLVVADSWSAPTGLLQRYESRNGRYEKTGKPVSVNLGRNGLGWSRSEALPHHPDEPVKQEGDGRAPAGIFALERVFGYARSNVTKMPYLHAGADLICIDDASSPFYNRIKSVDAGTTVKSFEWMHRDDDLYRIGVTVGHNRGALPGAGSCIFLHLQKAPGAPTSGCTSMAMTELRTIVRWLDPTKSPRLVQIPRSYCDAVADRFEGVSCP